mgnify:FL=1
MKKRWGGRFAGATSVSSEHFLASVQFDSALVDYDIQGSIAHAQMLGVCGIITQEEAASLQAGLREVHRRIAAGECGFTAADEDVHMWVERLLSEQIGPLAGKLHTARSRNDQVALDTHLFVREKVLVLMEGTIRLIRALMERADTFCDILLPGYTHLQRAQPVLWSHHLLAYAWMFERDSRRLQGCFGSANCSPLGAGALAGTTFPIDRLLVSETLSFDALYENSMDAVSDRDYLIDILSACATIMMHLSRLSEELVLWTSHEFGFVHLSDGFCTGSSIMPQKRNPDCAELIRGKCGRVYGALISLLTTMKGLPLAYNKDLQEDKECLFDAVRTTEQCLGIMGEMVAEMSPRAPAMERAMEQGFLNATELADFLAARGLPFRDAHHVVGALVLQCEREGKRLEDLSDAELLAASPLLTSDARSCLSYSRAVERRTSRGGTASTAVAEQRNRLEERVDAIERWWGDVRDRVSAKG